MNKKLQSQNKKNIMLAVRMPAHEIACRRQCFSSPIPEIFEAARLLDQAVTAHLRGDIKAADSYLRGSDIQAIGDWLDPLWLRKSDLVKARNVEGLTSNRPNKLNPFKPSAPI